MNILTKNLMKHVITTRIALEINYLMQSELKI